MVPERLAVVGGGLAGVEAAWQAANAGVAVDLYEMRPHRSGPAHKTDRLAELVCSNSLRGSSLENAVGLLKEELARLGSLVIFSARASAVPAGGALAVDRDAFAAAVESQLLAHPRVTVHRREVTEIPRDRPCVLACGPLPSQALLAGIDGLLNGMGSRRLHYFDAASPIVATDSLDETQMYRRSRYDKGDGDDYLNIPLDAEQYAALVHDLRTLERHQPKDFETGEARYFEGCLPIEEMADRGEETLRYGPLKPVGLRDPRTDCLPHAVVQLRKENALGSAYNLVGFQTRMTWPAQRAAFGKLPGMRDAEWLRLGVMHRNTFVDAPRVIDARLRVRSQPALYLAGQITGSEGYVEAAACGAMAGIHAARQMLGLPAVAFPPESAFGAIVAHLQNEQTHDFQPANVTWAPFPALETADRLQRRGKRERRTLMALRALRAIDALVAELAGAPVGAA